MADGTQLSDKALAVFAFAAYHELEGGQPVSKVILEDGAGHRADPEAVQELEKGGLASVEANQIVFSGAGLARLAATIQALKGA